MHTHISIKERVLHGVAAVFCGVMAAVCMFNVPPVMQVAAQGVGQACNAAPPLCDPGLICDNGLFCRGIQEGDPCTPGTPNGQQGGCVAGLVCVANPPPGVGGTCHAGAGGGANQPQQRLFRPRGPLRILQPLDDQTYWIPAMPGIDTVFFYFARMWPWILGVTSAFAVLQGLAGGIQVMFSGGDAGKREGGISRLMWACAGLLIIALAGFILRSINPLFYR